jgi:hypothetical protein
MNWSNVGLVEGGGSPVLAISHFGLIAPSEYAMREASVSYTSLAMSIRACVSVTSCSEVMPLPYAFLAEQVVDETPLCCVHRFRPRERSPEAVAQIVTLGQPVKLHEHDVFDDRNFFAHCHT